MKKLSVPITDMLRAHGREDRAVRAYIAEQPGAADGGAGFRYVNFIEKQ